jgi:hypothetical protein
MHCVTPFLPFKDLTIGKLEQDIASQKAPRWATGHGGLDIEYLEIIKRLGNWSIHPNDGDVAARAAADHEFLDLVAETFIFLLTLVYEVEH